MKLFFPAIRGKELVDHFFSKAWRHSDKQFWVPFLLQAL